MIKNFVILFFCFLPFALCGQIRDTTIIELDSTSGVKKMVHYNMNGTGGGWTGSAPRLTRRTITKYDSSGNLIYKSRYTHKLEGCIGSTLYHRIMVADTINGGWHTITMRSRGYKHIYRNAQNKRVWRSKERASYYALMDELDQN